MYDETSDTPALARTSNLNEDLGQIKYIFSDKTGTVTQNKMIFRQCSVGGVVYGEQITKVEHYVDTNLIATLAQTSSPAARSIHDFLLALALCHTVVPETNPGLAGPSTNTSVSVCLHVCLPVCLYVYRFIFLSVWLPVCLSIYLPVCLPICLPV